MPALDVVVAVATRTWKKTLRRPVQLSFSLVQPALWMLFFGFLFMRYRLERLPRDVRYLDFLLPGVCGMTVLFGASQSGVELVRDFQTGFLTRVLATPADRRLVLLGKVLADGLRLLVQASIVVVIGVLLGARLHISPPGVALGATALLLFAISFASISCLIAALTRAPEGMATFVHIVNMPLLFTSTALVPARQMPAFLESAAHVNPLGLAVDALRSALLFGEQAPLVGTLGPLAGLAVVCFAAAVRALGRAARD